VIICHIHIGLHFDAHADTVAEGKHALRLLDAQVVDVYQGTHAVLFMINPYDRQSLQYVV
jgi:hypothetical protein